MATATEDKEKERPISDEEAKRWIASQEGQEALASAKRRAKLGARQLETKEKKLSQLVRQKSRRTFGK